MKFILQLLILLFPFACFSQVPYGDNPTTGKYYNVGDVDIYYEVYGTGKPVVLLHGGLYGYINEFSNLIPKLQEKYQVIAIATRGHGKSGMGSKPFSYPQFADDTYKTIRHLTKDSVMIIGFSDGALQGYYLAADHPELVKRLVAIGGNFGFEDYYNDVKAFISQIKAETFEKNNQAFSASRKKIMPEPKRFDEFITKIAAVWNEKVYITNEKISSITTPTLIAAGQWDGCPIERYIALYRLLKNAQVAVIPGSDHLVLFRKPELMYDIINSYLQEK